MAKPGMLRRAVGSVLGNVGFLAAWVGVYAGGIMVGHSVGSSDTVRQAWLAATLLVAVLVGFGVRYGLRRLVGVGRT